MTTFKQLWERALYQRVAVTPAVSQCYLDLSCADDNDPHFSDILLHLPVLQWFASRSDRVTEFGVRNVVSTLALLAGAKGGVVSYDIVRSPAVDALLACPDLPVPWEFRQMGSLEAPVEPTDMLFVDTIHSGPQVKAELARHADSVRKYIAFHDTVTFADYNGYLDAILDFYLDGPWKLAYQSDLNNGLMVIERIVP